MDRREDSREEEEKVKMNALLFLSALSLRLVSSLLAKR